MRLLSLYIYKFNQGVNMNKSILKSKTFYFGLASALAPLFPGVGEFLAKNVEGIAMVWGALTILLRYVTKDKVVLVE